jgi:hypothetical protein
MSSDSRPPAQRQPLVRQVHREPLNNKTTDLPFYYTYKASSRVHPLVHLHHLLVQGHVEERESGHNQDSTQGGGRGKKESESPAGDENTDAGGCSSSQLGSLTHVDLILYEMKLNKAIPGSLCWGGMCPKIGTLSSRSSNDVPMKSRNKNRIIY